MSPHRDRNGVGTLIGRSAPPDRQGVAVLVSGGEHLGVLAAVRALSNAGHRAWVAVSDRNAYAARSRKASGIVQVSNPAPTDSGFARALALASARIPAAVVLPGTEGALVALSEHSGLFPPDVVLGICPPAVVSKATDKALFSQMATAAGLSVPATREVCLTDGATARGLSYPVVLKPLRSEYHIATGAHHYSCQLIRSPEQLRAGLAELPETRGLVQRYLPGPLGSIAGIFWNGQIIGAVQSRADRIWPPHCGSFTHAVTVPMNAGLSSSIADLLRAIGWNGLFQVDFIERSDACFVIDLNPRIYTSLAITTAAGVNLLAIWVDLLRGRGVDGNHAYRTGVSYRHDEDDIRALVRMLLRGPRREALRGLLPRRRTVHPVFSIRDPWPLLTSVTKLRRVWRSARQQP